MRFSGQYDFFISCGGVKDNGLELFGIYMIRSSRNILVCTVEIILFTKKDRLNRKGPLQDSLDDANEQIAKARSPMAKQYAQIVSQ